ncbi:MAG: glycerate 2-kinase [Chloroflexota bacterium]|nr:glycerate 2-kinase [Chloroflexota bacterium]
MARSFVNPAICPQFEHVNDILEAALEAVDPYTCTRRSIQMQNNRLKIGVEDYDLADIEHIHMLGTGKAVLPMALAVTDVLEERISGGVIIGKHADEQLMAKLPPEITVTFGDHPVPSEKSMHSAQMMADYCQNFGEKDLVICLISGGGSALMTLPVAGVNLGDMQAVTRQLLLCGATINEVNAVRKHLDRIKGGGLARLAWPAKLATLVLSDVIGDALDTIASGPTVADASTYQDVLDIVRKYKLESSLPKSVLAHFKAGMTGLEEIAPETVKSGDKYLLNAHIKIIGSLKMAIDAARERAIQAGFNVKELSSEVTGEAREIGKEYAQALKQLAKGESVMKKPAVLIAGGETTVTVQGDGKGGRNQECALSAAIALQGCPDCLFVSLATDGEDGPTDAAGGAVSGATISAGLALGLDAQEHLARNDAYAYLEQVNSLIHIGPTGTNVNDLIFSFAF